MEIDVTALFYSDTWAISGSRATHGEGAGPATWEAAKVEAAERPILSTPAEIAAFKTYVKDFGAWSDEEIAAWSDVECNALLAQMVAGDKREMGMDDAVQGADAELWDAIADDMAEGRIPSNMWRSDDGKVYYYVGS